MSILKICKKCYGIFPLSDFPLDSRKKPENTCQECTNRRKSAKQTFFRILYQRWKEQQSCVHCGESEPACLCLHHVNKDEKEGAIDKIIQRGRLMDIFIEIAKCVVMCHNCHARLHADLIVLPEGISNAVFYVVKHEPLIGHTKIIRNPLADYGQLELDIV